MKQIGGCGRFQFIVCLIAFAMIALGALISKSNAATSDEQVLYSFGQTGLNDGSQPYAGLIADSAGNLYGTTVFGGTARQGAVFRLSPTSTGWTETVLYSFCSMGGQCTDGYNPYAGLVMDGAGNLFGTTHEGGDHGRGTVFQLASTNTGWKATVLHSFCGNACPGVVDDGGYPYASLTIDAAGNLYGTAGAGGNNNGGVVFQLTLVNGSWTYTVLHGFCTQSGCAGADPSLSGVIIDNAGRLYGTTAGGGNNTNSGTVFRMTPNNPGWTFDLLYSFCSQTNCADGQYPGAGVIVDALGNLYGTTQHGGNSTKGVAFKLAPAISGYTETVLYSFCSQSNCVDGSLPLSKLTIDGAGILYGTTTNGGSVESGVVYKLTPTTNPTWTQTVLHTFCPLGPPCNDGAQPFYGSLILDAAGNLYGTTSGGGTLVAKVGVVFEVSNPGVALSVVENGSGTVLSSPAGIDCPSNTCSASFATGTQVTLSANPVSGWVFSGWGGPCSGTGTCTVTMTSAQSVIATFMLQAPSTFSLSVSTVGSGNVTSSPTGIDCPSTTCSASFAPGTQVTLSANPVSGWVFSGWGGPCSGTGTCTVTMTSAQSVIATFRLQTPNTFSLSVSRSGAGKVTSSPAGIDCPKNACFANFTGGTTVTLTVVPVEVSPRIVDWLVFFHGACSGSFVLFDPGTFATCTVLMNANKSVSVGILPTLAAAR